jgi:hypothetical protein
MRFKYLIILFLSLFICQSAISQKKDASKDDGSKKIDDSKVNPTRLNISRFQINDLKSRGIIVRLKTNKDRIAAYRKSGNTKVADKLETKSTAINQLLLYAFITEWSYSPLYFMESEHTLKLMTTDTLIAKTFDLQRDTAIYMAHDSFYIVDFGDLLDVDAENNPKSVAEPSTNPVPGSFLVVKDNQQEQLQPPMPYEAKVWLEEFTSTDKINPVTFEKPLLDSIQDFLRSNNSITDLLRSPAKATIQRFLFNVYMHVDDEKNKVSSSAANPQGPLNEGAPAAAGALVMPANPFMISVKHLNTYFIEYYCKRLDKDKNLLSSDDRIYWWMRNPNIRYLPYLHDLEVELKESLGKAPNLTK